MDVDIAVGDPLASLTESNDTGTHGRPVASRRARRALLASAALHLLLVGALVLLDRRLPVTTTPPLLHIALRPPLPAPEIPVPPASAAPETPPGSAPPRAQDATDPPAHVTPAAPATARPVPVTPPARPLAAGDTSAVEGMDLGYVEIGREDYIGILARWLRGKGTWYPPAARRDGQEGRALVRFSLDREGQLVALRVSESSGNPLLDEAALETVRRAAPFPPPPDGLPFAVIEDIYLPVVFRLEAGK